MNDNQRRREQRKDAKAMAIINSMERDHGGDRIFTSTEIRCRFFGIDIEPAPEPDPSSPAPDDQGSGNVIAPTFGKSA